MCKWRGFLRNTSIWSIFYVARAMLVIWIEFFCAPWIQCWIRIMRPEMSYHWMIWYWLGEIWLCTPILFFKFHDFGLKYGIVEKLWFNICRSICWFILVKVRVHKGSTLPSSVYKEKSYSSDLIDLSDQFYCFTDVCQWSLLRSECEIECIRILISDWLIV